MYRPKSDPSNRLLILCLLVWSGATMALAQMRSAAAPGYAYEVWTTEQGLPQNSVRALAQTRDGYLWVGTFAGLARFDGVQFTTFNPNNTPALLSSMILALYEDRNGVLWIGTDGKGFVKYEQGRFTNYPGSTETPIEWINRIWEDEAGNLCLMARHKPLQFKDGRFTAATTVTTPQRVLSLARDGSVLTLNEDGIERRHTSTRETYKLPQPLGMIFGAEARDGSFWLSTEKQGLLRFADGPPTVLNASPNAMFYRDREGDLRQLQLAQLLGLATEAEARQALKIGLVHCGLEDREGNLWLGTNGAGLLGFKRTPVRAYGAAQGLSDDSFTAIAPDGTGGLWLAGKQVYHYQNGPFNLRWPLEPWALWQDRAGGVWLGGGGRFKEGQLIKHPLFDDVKVVAFYEDRAGNLWIGATSNQQTNSRGGLYRYRDGVFTTYRTEEGLAANDVRTMTEDHTGALWLGTGSTGTLSQFKDGRFTNYTTAQGLTGKPIRDIYTQPDGTLWLATYGGGLTRGKDGRFVTVSTTQGLHDNFLSRILPDERGHLWISSNRGIIRLGLAELNEVVDGKRQAVESIVYGVTDGMKSSECNGGGQPAGARTADGRLWFPTVSGVVAVDPKQSNPLPPPVAIESVLVNGQTLTATNELTIAPGQGQLEIHYTALSFVAPQKVRFKYRLEGYDTDWIEAGARRVAYYSGLPPGTYQFRVIACNNDGVWNQTGASLSLRQRPRFYQTGWFYLICLLLVGLLGWGLYRLRVRQLLRHTQELESTVAARTAEVVEQNERLAQSNTEITQVNEQLQQTNGKLAEVNFHLDQANADLLTTLNRLRLGIVIVDAVGIISFVSEDARRLLGSAAATALGQNWVDVLPLHSADLALLQALSKLPTAQRTKLPVELQANGGPHYWVEIEVQDDPRERKRKIFCFYDVTEIYDLRSLLDEETQFLGLIGQTPAMQMIYKQINDLAPTNTTVLIAGETGVGKELAARAIHYASPRRNQPFIAVNSASLTESVLASQLFGHKRGAFTGATADHKGLFEEANKGTIFLDEISEIPLNLQASLLRVLQEGEILRLGDSRPRHVDVRVLAATNCDLTQAVAAGRFREDLFYRICVGRLSLPPLREHRDDIPQLAAAFLKQTGAVTGKDVREISREAMEQLLAYDWPGNVRELKSAIEVALINCRSAVLQASDLQLGNAPAALLSAAANLVSKQRLQQVLAQTQGNRAAAARLLGVSRTTLYRWLNEKGLE